jgi:hypothetical protein
LKLWRIVRNVVPTGLGAHKNVGGNLLVDGRVQGAQPDDDDTWGGIASGVNAGTAITAEISMMGWLVSILPQNVLPLRNAEAGARNPSDRLKCRPGRLPADGAMAKKDRPQRFIDLILDLSAKTTAFVHRQLLSV